MDTFMNERIQSEKTPFHASIVKQTPTLFKQQQVKRKKKDQAKDFIRVNRDILGKLLSIFTKLQSPIDFRSVHSCSIKHGFSRWDEERKYKKPAY